MRRDWGRATQIVEAVIVGNTAMHHLFLRLPVEQLATCALRAGACRRPWTSRPANWG